MKIIYAIRDKKMGTHFPPMYASHITELTRALTEIVNNSEHQFGKYSTDFELYQLGEFNEQTAEIKFTKTNQATLEIESLNKPEFIMDLSQLKYKKEQNHDDD